MVDVTEDEVREHLVNGTAQLWPGERSALVTQLVLRSERILHFLLGGGELQELVVMHSGVAAWGRAMGAHYATINGRPGWARVLRAHGFERRDGNLLRKAL